MKYFLRYPHVRDLIIHYANFFSDNEILEQQKNGVKTAQEAEQFSLFIWKMVDQMRLDTIENIIVLGSSDNSEMLQDIYYEVGSFMSDCGFESVWERVSADA